MKHVMALEDKETEKFHKGTDHNSVFIESLYPMCTEMPRALTYNEID